MLKKIRENVEVDKKSPYVIYEWPIRWGLPTLPEKRT